MAPQQNSRPPRHPSSIVRAKAVRPTEFRTLVGLVTALQRLERLAQQDGRGCLSPQELLLLQARITRLRATIPSDVLNSYETVKRYDPKAFVDPQLFALMVLLAVITVWAGHPSRHSDFQDHIGRITFRVRRVTYPSLRCHARQALVQKRRSL